jgi:hypothetical protein
MSPIKQEGDLSVSAKISRLYRLANEPIVVGVRSDPEPKISVIDFNGESSIPQADTD